MRRIIRTMLGGVCLAVFIAPALALMTFNEREEFGPAREQERKSADKRLALTRLPGRVYLYQKDWQGPLTQYGNHGVAAYQGDAEAANRALGELAQMPADTVREIHLLPAPGVSRSRQRNTVQACDYEIRWSNAWSGRGKVRDESGDFEAKMILYIDRAAPPRPLDPRAAQWIKDLDSERFNVRQAAFDNLAEQRDAALPLLQATQGAKDVTLEARRRVEQLLKRLEPIHAARLRLPDKVPVYGPDELLKREAGDWRSGNLAKSWTAANQISTLAEFTEESFPLLIEMLGDDRPQVRDLAAVAFEQLGSRASGAVPALKAASPKMKPESAPALARALAAVTLAPNTEDPWRQNRQRRAEIGQFLRERKP
jgi:hypothetical protein